MVKTIAREALKARLGSANPPMLLEALPARHFTQQHLPGAVHAPHDRIGELADILPQDKAAEIVVYCASATCRNSHSAAKALEEIGYRNVAVYPGGKQDWLEAGLPTESGGKTN